MLKKILQKIKNKLAGPQIIVQKVLVPQGRLLEGKVALIVGGTGGIGYGIAKCFLEHGAKVIITGTNREKLKTVSETPGQQVRCLEMDVTDIKRIPEKIAEASGFFGSIDILVNSAGVHGAEPFGSVSEETYDQVLNINLKGTFFVCQEVSNYMVANHIRGRILNVGSASCAKPAWTPYEISKWGVRGFTLGLADKMIPHGIVVNSIAPGPVATPMLHKNDASNLVWPANPAGRMATAEEIANLALFMVSDMGSLIVGDTYFISGGSGTIRIDR